MMKKVLLSCLTIFLFGINMVKVQALDESYQYLSNKNIDQYLEENFDEIDWNEVDEVYVLYDDGTTPITDNVEKEKMDNAIKNTFPLPRLSDFERYFSKVVWISRSGVDSLSVTPKNMNLCYSFKEESWRALYLTFHNHPLWRTNSNSTKDASMYNQYVCHADWATQLGKTPWNLEPSTKDKGYWGFVSSACN